MFMEKSETKVNVKDSTVVLVKDSVITRDSVKITGRTIVDCDTTKKGPPKPKPFYQKATTGLVTVEFWIDSTGQFNYIINQDAVTSRISSLEKQLTQSRDSTATHYIPIPQIEYRLNVRQALFAAGIGSGIGFLLLFLIRRLFPSSILGFLKRRKE